VLVCEPVDSVLVVLSVVASVDDEIDVLVPDVVGSDKDVAVAVSSTEILGSSMAVRPEAAAETVAARSDAEPQPYWKYPPSYRFW
jgi:hypothetical protein